MNSAVGLLIDVGVNRVPASNRAVVEAGLLPAVAVAGLLGGAAALLYLQRYRKVVQTLPVRPRETVRLLALTPLLPRKEACLWVADLERQLADLEPQKRHEWRVHARRSFFGLVREAWAAWTARRVDVARDLVSWTAAAWVLPRISRVNAQLRSKMSVWPKHDEQRQQLQRQWRKLRYWSRLLVRCVSERHHPKIVTNAAWLARSCTGLLAEQARTDRARPEDRLPYPLEVAYMLEINHTTLVVTGLLEGFVSSRQTQVRRIGGTA